MYFKYNESKKYETFFDIFIVLLNVNNNVVSEIAMERVDLSVELVLLILTALTLTSGFVASYEWVKDQNYFWVAFLAISSIGTMTSYLYFGFKNKIPKFKTKKIKQVKSIIFMAAFLLAFGQASSISLFLYEGLAEYLHVDKTTKFMDARNTAIIYFDAIIPVFCFVVFYMTKRYILNCNKKGMTILPEHGW